MKTYVLKERQVKIRLILLAIGFLAAAFTKVAAQNCLYYDGNKDGIRIEDDNSLDFSNKGTIEAWIYVNSFEDWTGLIHKGENSNFSDEAYSLQFWGNSSGKSNKYLAFALNDNNGNQYFTYSNSKLELNKWYHIALVWNSDSYYAKLYINGVLDKQITISHPIKNSSGDLFIGCQYNKGYTFHGKMDQVRLWSQALSQNEIRAYMYSELGDSFDSLSAYYKLDETSGLVANDATSNNNDGSLINMQSSAWQLSTMPLGHYWIGDESDNWNSNSNWFAGWMPTSTTPVIIPASTDYNCTIKNDKECNALTIESGASLTIQAGESLKLNGNFVNNGVLLVESNSYQTGSFIDNGNISGTGTMKIERYIPKNGWHYVSVPVSNCSSNVFWGAAVYAYDEPSGNWDAIKANETLNPNKGYDIFYQENNSYITFSGTFNTGETTNSNLTSQNDGWNFIGNPYPSYIDWSASSGLEKTNIENAIYIWDAAKNTFISFIDGVGSHTDVTSKIAPTQGFWVKTKSGKTGSLAMNNGIRVTSSSDIFRSETNFDVLNLTIETNGKMDQTSIAFKNYAIDEFSDEEDAHKMFSSQPDIPQIYTTTTDNYDLSINSITTFEGEKTIPLNVKANVSGQSSLYISDFSKYGQNMEIYIEDLKDGNIHNLKTGAYKFNIEVNDNESRFLIHFFKPISVTTPNTITDTDNQIDENPEIKIFANSNSVYIDTKSVQGSTKVNIYNIYGQMVYSNNNMPKGSNKINLNVASGYYIVRLESPIGTINQKVMIKR